MRFDKFTNIAVVALCLTLASVCSAQNAATPPVDGQKPADQAPAPAAPAPLPTPAITGPLQGLPPATFDAGPFGKIAANGFLSGMFLGQNNHVPGDKGNQEGLSNGQVFVP